MRGLSGKQVSIEFIPAKQEPPNGLNVWRHGNVKSFRVLDVIWTDGTMPLILAYRGGEWERLLRQELLAAVIKCFVALETCPNWQNSHLDRARRWLS